jgi:O-succinylbenzoate synthase
VRARAECPGPLARTLPRVTIRVRAVELFRVRLPLRAPFRTARSTTVAKDALLVRVVTDDAEGWGEVGAEVAPTYAPDTLDTARLVLRDELVPRLYSGAGLEDVRGHHPARAALLGAVLDARLRAEGTPLAAHLGGVVARVDAGVAIGSFGEPADVARAATAFVDDGYASLKLKIEPKHDVAVVAAVRGAVGDDVTIQADANGSYALDDVDRLRALDAFGLACLEQPLAPPGLLDHARLGEQLGTPIGLDETITSATVARDAIALRACAVVSIKAALVGGVEEARTTHDACVAGNVAARAGGMLETGVGRAALVALASLPGFTLAGDLSASNRYFEEDLTAPFELAGGSLAVPTGPGIGVTPLPEVLARRTLARERIARP